MIEPRVGLGFDVHGWGSTGTLRLAGVSFPERGALLGHSDGDVVCHAVADGLLGAAALGDLGEHFPDTEPGIAGIGGLELLGEALEKVRAAGFEPMSVDVTVIADQPAIGPVRAQMRANLADALGLEPERVSVKATRPEGLGLTGSGVGCLALAVVARA
ncbi:MAG: 2-C-methyl-D-erythritol 2,4-cyclodiphosphate synthase [Candidatus Velamenicoccus archaeovorus]